jgi:hypothetical protein
LAHALCVILLSALMGASNLFAQSSDTDMANRHLRSAEQGNLTAQIHVGALYSMGIGLRQSDTDAFRWFLRAAEQGHSQAQVIVAAHYAIGKGTAKDDKSAYRWAYAAANGGDASIKNGAVQLMDVLSTRLSADERADAIKGLKQPGKAASATPEAGGGRKFDYSDSGRPKESLSSEAYYKRGQDRARRGEYALAIDDFSKVLDSNPSDVEALNNRCWTRFIVGRTREALSDCDQALRLKPDYADALDSRGLVKLKLGELDGAISDFNKALNIKPNLASSLYGRGKAKLRKGNSSSGNADVRAARALDSRIEDEFSRYGID